MLGHFDVQLLSGANKRQKNVYLKPEEEIKKLNVMKILKRKWTKVAIVYLDILSIFHVENKVFIVSVCGL